MNSQTAKVTMYRTRSCPFCVAAEDFLDAKGVEFDQIFLDDHPDRRAFVASIKPGHWTVPLVVIADEPIGGYDELRALDASGGLEARVFAPRP